MGGYPRIRAVPQMIYGVLTDRPVSPIPGQGEVVCRRAILSMAWCTPFPFRRQSRRIFHAFIRAKTCSTRARTLRWDALRSSYQAGNSA